MRASKGLWSGLFAFAFLIVPVHLSAQQLTQVTIGATSVSIPAGATSVSIAGPYTWNGQTIAITNYNGTARVELVSPDVDIDRLGLFNAEITANTAVSNFPIVFSAAAKQLPSVPAGGEVWYHTNGTGSFSPYGSAQKDKNEIILSGFLDNDSSGSPNPWDRIGNELKFTVSCTVLGCGNFSPAKGFKTAEAVTSLANDRDLKGDVKFTLANVNDKLRISSIYVMDGPAPGTGPNTIESTDLPYTQLGAIERIGDEIQDINQTMRWLLIVVGVLAAISVVVLIVIFVLRR